MIAHSGGTDESLSIVLLAGAIWMAWAGRARLGGRRLAGAPRWVGYILFAGAALTAVSAAWLPRALLGPGTTPMPAGTRPSPVAFMMFTAPVDGSTVSDDEMQVVLDLRGGTVVTGSTPVTPDTGHIHLMVDGKTVSMTYGTMQVVDLRPYGPGTHTLEAEFVAADHLPFEPPVVARITFRIEGG